MKTDSNVPGIDPAITCFECAQGVRIGREMDRALLLQSRVDQREAFLPLILIEPVDHLFHSATDRRAFRGILFRRLKCLLHRSDLPRRTMGIEPFARSWVPVRADLHISADRL